MQLIALLELTDRIYEALDSNEYAISVFLDFLKAFDVVNRAFLLLKLYRYGFHGIVHKWLYNYVQNRRHSVLINGHESTRNKMQHGVPLDPYKGLYYF